MALTSHDQLDKHLRNSESGR